MRKCRLNNLKNKSLKTMIKKVKKQIGGTFLTKFVNHSNPNKRVYNS